MVKLTGRSIYKQIVCVSFCVSMIWVSCSKNEQDVYKPNLGIYEEFFKEEAKIFNKLVDLKNTIDTTTNANVFNLSKSNYDLVLTNYKYIIEQAELSLQNKSFEDNYNLESLYNKMVINRKQFDFNAYIYNQVEKEGVDVLINFNVLKNELGLNSNNTFDIFNSFDVVEKNINKYEKIEEAYRNLDRITNKNEIMYYSEDPNQYQVIFICANLKDLITIRTFLIKSEDLYLNRTNKSYVESKVADFKNITKRYKNIGNRRELCDLYAPISSKDILRLEYYATRIAS